MSRKSNICMVKRTYVWYNSGRKIYHYFSFGGNIMEKKHAAIYIRVSTDAQAEEGYSIDAQKEQLTAYCVSKGIKKYEYYIDGGWTGSNINRPEMQRLIRDVMDNKVSHCIVYKLDRLSRSQKDTLYLIEDVFNPRDVAFVSLHETMDTSTPMGRLMIGILSAFAQLERENIKLRTQMGMEERVKSGYWPGGGKTPIGYDYDQVQGILVPNEEAKKVKELYSLYINGYSAQKIADMLGFKYDKLAMQILKRKSNYGIIQWKGKEYQGRHEPIISKETYDAAMAEMERRSVNNVKDSNYLLTGLVYCGKCGAKMRYQNWGKGKWKLCCYSQQKSKKYLIKDPNCDQPKMWSNEAEEIVVQKMLLLKTKKQPTKNQEVEYREVISVLNEQKSEIEQKLRRLYNLYADSDSETLLDTIKEQEKKLDNIKKEIMHEVELIGKANKKSKAYSVLENFLPEKWELMGDFEKQKLVRSLVHHIKITDDEVYIKFNI